MASKHLINKQITLPLLTVIAPDGTKHGPISKSAAHEMSLQYDLDLVLVSSTPPVAKLMNYGKFLFEEKKKQHDKANDPETKRKQAFTEMKEITLSYRIAEHDFQVCVTKAARFLQKGHRVRCSIRLKGREQRYHEMAADTLKRLAVAADPACRIEKPPYPEGNRIVVVLLPPS